MTSPIETEPKTAPPAPEDASLLHVVDAHVRGEIAVDLAPGTIARDRDRRLDALLGPELERLERTMHVALAASPSAFARPLPGKDDQGRTRFVIHGRFEGDRLVPVHPPKSRASRAAKQRR